MKSEESDFFKKPFNTVKTRCRDNSDFGFIGEERKSKIFKKAARHSRQVNLLKYLLPSIGVAIIILVMVMLVLWQKKPGDISIMAAKIENGKLIMQNPRLNGFDEKKRPYSMEALRAVQSVEDPTRVKLDQIQAKLPIGQGSWANIKAKNGHFDAKNKKLQLGGGVNVITTDGMKIQMNDAYINLEAGTLKTNRSIVFNNDRISASSQSLEVFENGAHIIFDTNVRLTIQPSIQNVKNKR